MTERPSAFEILVREFLAAQPGLRHEWKVERGWLAGERLEIMILPTSPASPEVWASENDVQIAVGVGNEHTDFEDFGRPMSDEEVAQEAFSHFVELLREHGYVRG